MSCHWIKIFRKDWNRFVITIILKHLICRFLMTDFNFCELGQLFYVYFILFLKCFLQCVYQSESYCVRTLILITSVNPFCSKAFPNVYIHIIVCHRIIYSYLFVLISGKGLKKFLFVKKWTLTFSVFDVVLFWWMILICNFLFISLIIVTCAVFYHSHIKEKME